MAQIREYRVTLIPAEVKDGCVSFIVGDPNSQKHKVTAPSLGSLEAQVRVLAKAFGQTCSVYVSLPPGVRKPPGFDAATRRFQTIKFVPEEQKAA